MDAGERALTLLDLKGDRPGRTQVESRVSLCMVGDLMARSHDLSRDVRLTEGIRPNLKERCAGSALGQSLEHGGCTVARAIVKCECYCIQ